jgi:hypothetical protein
MLKGTASEMLPRSTLPPVTRGQTKVMWQRSIKSLVVNLPYEAFTSTILALQHHRLTSRSLEGTAGETQETIDTSEGRREEKQLCLCQQLMMHNDMVLLQAS